MGEKPILKFLIVGAGFSGIGLAIQLKKRGINNFRIVERAEEVGGTWRENVYPGCACDIPSNLYSYSFAPNPEWSRGFSSQPEILAYLKSCIQRFDLGNHLQFKTSIASLQYDEATTQWTAIDSNGNQFRSNYIALATGPLNRPVIPSIEGKENFSQPNFHTSRWDHTVDLKGKRVGIIGTGASAIQIIPSIAAVVESLAVYQRTPAWVIPRNDWENKPWMKMLYRYLPFTQQLFRYLIYSYLENSHKNFQGNQAQNLPTVKRATKHIQKQVKDPELQAKLTPDYRIGCKRILVSDDYYPTFNRENVELITTKIQRLTTNGMLTEDGKQRDLDVLIWATGFNAAEDIIKVEVKGIDGRTLAEDWNVEGPEAYLGTCISGYPNLFVLLGPNANLGHNSLIHVVESQLNFIFDCIKMNEAAGSNASDIKAEVQQVYNQEIQERLQNMVWESGCSNWYRNEAGRNTTLWPGSTRELRRRLRKANPADFNFYRKLLT